MHLDSTTVGLIAQPTYQQPQLDQALDQVLTAITDCGTLRTAQVLLKPNLITAGNGQLPCTDGRFIAAVARWFLAQGARVTVGDSPSFGSARAVLAAIGALPMLRTLGIPVVEFKQTREVLLPCGRKAVMAAAAMDCDFLVNLPRVKAHSQMRVTLAVKNYFGCVAGFHKPWWHMVHGGSGGQFSALLVDLLAILPPSLSVVDGIVAMHQTGPIHGEPFPLRLVAGGANPVAVDTALLALLGIAPVQSPLQEAARRAGLKGTEWNDLKFVLAAPAEFAVHGFIAPTELGPIRFNPFRFVKNSVKRLLLRVGDRCR